MLRSNEARMSNMPTKRNAAILRDAILRIALRMSAELWRNTMRSRRMTGRRPSAGPKRRRRRKAKPPQRDGADDVHARRDPALAGGIRPRPRQHRRRLRGSRIPRRRSVAARRHHLARERKAPGADLQPHAAIRAPDHRRHAAGEARASRWCRSIPDRTGKSRACAPG